MQQLALFGGNAVIKEKIPAFSPIGEEERKAVNAAMGFGVLSGFYGSPQPAFFGGTHVKAFEKAWCEKFGVNHAISVNSATSALITAMGAIGLSPGDEVIIPPYTMSATAMAPLIYGGIPKFVDIEADTFCLDPDLVEQAITKKTKAIIAVNLFGHPAHLSKLRRISDHHGIWLIEDNAQAIMATESNQLTGTVGHIGIFSLNIHKHIQTGEGGVLTTDADELALRMQLIRNHGENAVEWQKIEDITNLIGFNFRLPELAAAIGIEQLKKVDMLVSRCVEIGKTFSEGMKSIKALTPPLVRDNCQHSYFMWTATLENDFALHRDRIVRALQAEGVPVTQGYVRPLYRLPVFQKKLAIGSDHFPFTLGSTTYDPSCFPIVEACHYQKVIQIQPVSWNFQVSHLEQIIHAFDKVFSQIDEVLERELV